MAHIKPLRIEKDDLVLLADGWPLLEVLHLNATPKLLMDTTLNLDALEALANHTNLRSIQLYVNGSSVDGLVPSSRKFSKLQELYLGYSPIDRPTLVSTYLNKVLPPGVHFMTDRAEWKEQFTLPRYREAYTQRQKLWQDVGDLLPFLLNVTKDLEDENRLLREKNGALEDKIASIFTSLLLSA